MKEKMNKLSFIKFKDCLLEAIIKTVKKYSLSDKGLAAKTYEESLKSLRESQLNRKNRYRFWTVSQRRTSKWPIGIQKCSQHHQQVSANQNHNGNIPHSPEWLNIKD